MHRISFVILFISFAHLSSGVPVSEPTSTAAGTKKNSDYYSDDYYNADDEYADEQEKVVHRNPKFISQGTNQLINEGDTIKLPCLADKLEGFVLIWKKGHTILALGKQLMVKDDPRVKLEESENGNTLVISLAETQDAGEYICQISNQHKPTELRHSVRIRVAPEIRPVPADGVLVVKEGEPANLACEIIKGSPTPEITWRRKERKLPSGEEEVRGSRLSYPKSSRHHSGNYICSASNGFGTPTTAHIVLDVQHAPSIEQEQMFIHTRETDDTEVVCIVHASPRADVVWLKNGKPLTSDSGAISQQQRGNRHTLVLLGVKGSTFGKYTCRATNKFGSDERSTEVSGHAGPVSIKSSPDGEEKHSYALEWVAQSKTPITAFKLQYRRIGENYIEPIATTAVDVENSNANHEWTEETVTPLNNGDDFYSGQFVLQNLDSASHYLARIASSNSYGFGKFSPTFRFGTKGAAPVQQPSIGGGASGQSSTLFSSLVCLGLLLLVFRRV